ncbi:MAG: hypothetical protein IKO84_08790 [Butyrivibrio sp.]|nr:hypothetical protein [Butyrivibrio sp.]
MNDFKLNENDLIEREHLPIMLIMNMVSEERFLSVLEALSDGHGFGEECGACTLPDDLDDFDRANGENLDGAEFGLYSGGAVIIDYKTLYFYLKIICDRYLKENVIQSDIVIAYLEKFRSRFLI